MTCVVLEDVLRDWLNEFRCVLLISGLFEINDELRGAGNGGELPARGPVRSRRGAGKDLGGSDISHEYNLHELQGQSIHLRRLSLARNRSCDCPRGGLSSCCDRAWARCGRSITSAVLGAETIGCRSLRAELIRPVFVPRNGAIDTLRCSSTLLEPEVASRIATVCGQRACAAREACTVPGVGIVRVARSVQWDDCDVWFERHHSARWSTQTRAARQPDPCRRSAASLARCGAILDICFIERSEVVSRSSDVTRLRHPQSRLRSVATSIIPTHTLSLVQLRA